MAERTERFELRLTPSELSLLREISLDRKMTISAFLIAAAGAAYYHLTPPQYAKLEVKACSTDLVEVEAYVRRLLIKQLDL